MSAPEATSPSRRPKGIPEGHPSIGRHVREPVEGPSWPQNFDHGGARIITPRLDFLWEILLTIWVLYSRLAYICPYFKDPDAAKLAFGVAQRLQGVSYADGVFYQIEKQLGSYMVFEFLARIFSVDIANLESFLAFICAAFMVGILALTYSLGHMIWGRRVALISTTLLSMSPMMWITGEYPTTLVPALFFFMLAVWAMVVSYRVKGGRWWLAASTILFGWSIIVRADMVLGMLVPVCYALFVDRRGLRRALLLYLGVAIVLILAFAWFRSIGILLPEILAVGPHRPDYGKSLLLNWWGMGPFLFVFAFAGFVYRFVSDRKPLPFIFFWIVGFNTFYTGHLYSPRYFISYYPVVSWLAAFSIIALYSWVSRLVRFNRPVRLVFMALLIVGALTMLTTSTIKDGDRGTRIAWGETITYTRSHGLYPTGATWFYMQDFRRGEGLQYSWLEDAASNAARDLFDLHSENYVGTRQPIYVGSESQVFLNYFLLANGWKFTRLQGPFVEFEYREPPPDLGPGVAIDWTGPPPQLMQTVYMGDEPVPELVFLGHPIMINVFLAREAIPRLLNREGQVGVPRLTTLTGWHVGHSYHGLDLLVPGPMGGQDDGTINVERELLSFFHTDQLPRIHVDIFPSEDDVDPPGGVVTSHDGQEETLNDKTYLGDVSEITWTIHPQPGQWLALTLNYAGLLRQYDLYIDGENIESIDGAEWLATNVPGYRILKWDIVLIPPDAIDSTETEFRLEGATPGSVFDIVWVQRNYPDSQYRNEVARRLNLEYKDIECVR